MSLLRSSAGILLLAAVVAAGAVAGSAGGASGRAVVDPRVLADTAGGKVGHFLVVLKRQANTEAAGDGDDWTSQGQRVVRVLRDAARAQKGIEAELRRLGAQFRSYWIVDAIAVTGKRTVVEAMAAREDVAAIESDRAVHGRADTSGPTTSAKPQGVEWNIDKIGAPAVWRLGYTGQNLVYANADTGVQWDHPALRPHYRGWNGSAATHDFNWHDAIHSDLDGDGGNVCGFNETAPCDDTQHGTHVMGIGVGDDGAGNQIGVAPGAKWIGCRNMDSGTGRPSTYIECLQFFLAPTDSRGANPDPSKRPNAVGNSYTCPPEEGCGAGSLQAAVDNMRAAGIFMAVSAGNEGRQGCASLTFPPALYDSSITIGATDSNDQIGVFSSRGPVDVDGSGRRKPDLVAPGVNVRSSIPGGGYRAINGTSMASPHVAGAVLLLWSAFPSLRSSVDQTEQLLEQTAVKLTTTDGCGGDSSVIVPNNTYGHGRIDVLAAFRAAEIVSPPALSIADVSLAEGRSGTTNAELAVTLSRAATQTVTVQFATADGTAREGSDYRTTSGALTFASGETKKTISVPVIGDTAIERDETLVVRLSKPTNATLGTDHATVTIENDDADRVKPVLSGLALRPSTFPVTGSTQVRYVLSEAGVTAFTVRSGSRTIGRFEVRGKAGRNSFLLDSRRVRRRLKAGSYSLTAVPRDLAGNVGNPVVARFKILP